MIVGNALGEGYGLPPKEETWGDQFRREINGNYNPRKVHFIGTLNHPGYLNVLQESWVHVYLTIPFVLSLSLLEAMSCGCAMVGSSTAPIQEVIRHKENALLSDFFDPEYLSKTVCALLEDRQLA